MRNWLLLDSKRGNSLTVCCSFSSRGLMINWTMEEPYPWVLCAHCSWERGLAAVPHGGLHSQKEVVAGWQKAFGEFGNMFSSKYPAHHLKYQEGALTLVCHYSIRWFVQLSVWSNFLPDSCPVPTSPNSVGHGFHGAVLESTGSSAPTVLHFFIRVMKVRVVQKFGKHELFWINFSLGIIGIFIFIQIKKIRHISQEPRKHAFKPQCFTFWITWLEGIFLLQFCYLIIALQFCYLAFLIPEA